MPGFLRVNMRPSCLSHVQNVSPSEARRIFAGKTNMFRFVFFNVFVCFLGVCFWGLLCLLCLFDWFVELCVVFFVFNLEYICCLWIFCSVEILFFETVHGISYV